MPLIMGSVVSVQYVETERLENITVLPAVMGARDSSDAVYGKITSTHAGISKVHLEALKLMNFSNNCIQTFSDFSELCQGIFRFS